MQIEYEIDKLKKLLEIKKNDLVNNNVSLMELKKIEALEKLFNNERCFFNITFDVAINILQFLGIEDSDLLPTYKKLISYDLLKSEIKFIEK